MKLFVTSVFIVVVFFSTLRKGEGFCFEQEVQMKTTSKLLNCFLVLFYYFTQLSFYVARSAAPVEYTGCITAEG